MTKTLRKKVAKVAAADWQQTKKLICFYKEDRRKLLRRYGVGDAGVVLMRINDLQIQPTAVDLKQWMRNQVISTEAPNPSWP